MTLRREDIDWDKGNGLVPAIVQSADDGRVLMLGYMSPESLQQTQDTGLVTFFSRSRQSLWVKGETSGNILKMERIMIDCDQDTVLVLARPAGPVCHTGAQTCFDGNTAEVEGAPVPGAAQDISFLTTLSGIIKTRHQSAPEDSYTGQLFAEGPSRIAQKIGEEGVETALALVKADTDEIKNEAADLLFHLMVGLEASGLSLGDVAACLRARHGER